MDSKAFKELNGDKLKAKSCNDIKELIKICNCLGRKYWSAQRYDEAIAEHKEELRYSHQINCRLSEAIARRALGECYSEISEYRKALAEHKKYLSLVEGLGDRIEIQRAFATIGRTHLLRAQELQTNDEINKNILIEAKNSFEKALKLCDDLTELKDKELAEMRSRLYLNLGLVFEIMGSFTEAMTRFHLSIALNKRFGFNEDLYRTQLSLASVYEKNKEFEKASNSYEELIKTAKTLKDKSCLCDALICKALVLMRLQKVEESRKWFKKAYKLKHLTEDDNQKAVRFLKISSIICEDIRELSESNDLDKKISLCDRLGDHFVELRMFDKAIDYYKQELNLSLQCDKSDAEIAKIYVSIGQTFADDLRYELAIEYFTHELNCNRGNCVEECKSLIKMAEMREYMKRKEFNSEIIDCYEKASEKINSLDKNLLIDVLQRYLAFLESNHLNGDKVLELKERLKILNLQKTTVCQLVEDEDEPDIYDNYDLNDISDASTDSDEEEAISGSRPKRLGKTLKRNQLGETPLHRACIEGKAKQVQRLIADKHPINVRDNCGWTPLHEAVNNGHLTIVELLLKAGADVNDSGGPNCDGITPLHDACSNGHFSIARLLMKNGAKVTFLTNNNDTPLDSLRDWKDRCSRENSLNENDLREYQHLDKDLDSGLKRAGFVKKKIPVIQTKSRPKKHLPLIRCHESSPEDSDDSLSTSIIRVSDTRNRETNMRSGTDMELDFDDPRVARKQYSSTISNLRRNKDPNSDMFNDRRPQKSKPIPALLDEQNMINDEQWLINDVNDTRKRSCLDAYDALNKRTKTMDLNQPFRPRKPKPKSNEKRNQTERPNNRFESFPSDNGSDSDIESTEPIVESIQEINKIVNKNNKTNLDINRKTNDFDSGVRTHSKPIQVRVCVGDSDNTLLVIPILNRSSNCLWLNKEVEKRYFSKFSVKPVLSLQTTDGALLSDEDCILDVITGDELKVNAKIESWVLDPLHERYKDICNSSAIKAIPEIVSDLEMTQINGCLKLNDLNIPLQQIKPIFRALQRQNNLREIDISCSNIIIDDSVNCLNCLNLLPSLQVLNLKCTAIGLQTIELLLTKSCPNLVELNLSFNTFGDYFCELITQLVKHFNKLNVIDLSACDFTNHFLDSNQLNESIKNSNLRSVILDYNSIDSELIERFRNL